MTRSQVGGFLDLLAVDASLELLALSTALAESIGAGVGAFEDCQGSGRPEMETSAPLRWHGRRPEIALDQAEGLGELRFSRPARLAKSQDIAAAADLEHETSLFTERTRRPCVAAARLWIEATGLHGVENLDDGLCHFFGAFTPPGEAGRGKVGAEGFCGDPTPDFGADGLLMGALPFGGRRFDAAWGWR